MYGGSRGERGNPAGEERLPEGGSGATYGSGGEAGSGGPSAGPGRRGRTAEVPRLRRAGLRWAPSWSAPRARPPRRPSPCIIDDSRPPRAAARAPAAGPPPAPPPRRPPARALRTPPDPARAPPLPARGPPTPAGRARSPAAHRAARPPALSLALRPASPRRPDRIRGERAGLRQGAPRRSASRASPGPPPRRPRGAAREGPGAELPDAGRGTPPAARRQLDVDTQKLLC
ncbi:proline-rich protein HaeIII subfamily 1-like [Rhinolophus ferrumequinum]|uniref:proline-rich protein HaeIII subfamily 1-like n=1 Tax=Rhinolophus ferrumequinum TaxID=59479 RepID=UPI00140FD1A4|nr:proline-rich protein HaeIII subfamily 1-like [Rhinolophus ferrumequinum]